MIGSVCSGIGGAELAFEGLGGHAFASEIDPFARAILQRHFPRVALHGDFREIEHDGPVDVLVGGTPCQSFSVAGLRRGLADERGNLAPEYLRLARRLRARWVLWENVPGVLSSGGGRDFGAFLAGLEQCGYGWAYRTLDAQYFGLAQRRKRVFVVGCLGDWRRAASVLFEPASLRGNPAPRREAREGVAAALTRGAESHGKGGYAGRRREDDSNLIAAPLGAKWRGDLDNDTYVAAYRLHSDGSTAMRGNGNAAAAAEVDVTRSLDTCGGFTAGQGGNIVAHTLRADGFDASEDGTGRGTPLVAAFLHNNKGRPSGRQSRHTEMVTVEKETVPTLATDGHAQSAVAIPLLEIGKGSSSRGEGPNGAGFGADGDPMFTLQAGAQHGIATSVVRRLTPTECERLQGYPDGWTAIEYRGKPAADGPRYRALGNAFAVPVVRWIARRLAAEHARLGETRAAA